MFSPKKLIWKRYFFILIEYQARMYASKAPHRKLFYRFGNFILDTYAVYERDITYAKLGGQTFFED